MSQPRRSWSFAIGVILGLVMLVFAIRQVDWSAVADAVAGAAPGWLALAVFFMAAAQVLFASRWHVIVRGTDDMPFRDAFDFLAIGALAGLVLPPRLSDVARAVAAGRFRETSATGLFGTIVVERLLDVLMLVLFGAGVSALMRVPPLLFGALLTLLAIVAAAVVVLGLGATGPIGIVTRWAGTWRGPGSRVHATAERFLAGTSVIRERTLVPYAFAITLVGWISAAACAGVTLAAFGVSAPWYAGAFIIVIINLAGILPAPPAGIGVYHYSAMMAVAQWLPDPSQAFAYALVNHATSVAVVLTFGTWSLAHKGLSLASLRQMAAQPQPKVPE